MILGGTFVGSVGYDVVVLLKKMKMKEFEEDVMKKWKKSELNVERAKERKDNKKEKRRK